MVDDTAPASRPARAAADVLCSITFEVIPFRRTEEAVLEHVPADVPLTVTATAAKGIGVTIDLAGRLARHGYQVAPHLPARMIASTSELAAILARLDASGIRRVFVIGGDAPEPAGEFPDACALLRAMDQIGYQFDEVGIGGYPEGHVKIPGRALDDALDAKAALATRVITQICFDASTTVDWARRLRERHPGLEVRVGVPAPVGRQKLMRIAAGLGLGQSARFLAKQQNTAWRLLRPGGYRPDRLVRAIARQLEENDTSISGFHLFTFNELERAEAWRRAMLGRRGGL